MANISTVAQKHTKKPQGLPVEAIAKAVGLSAACVYQHISKDNPTPVSQKGKRKFYSESYIDSLKQAGIRPRARRVSMVRKNVYEERQEPSKPVVEESRESILARVQSLESTVRKLEAMIGVN
jgi:predicted transcriptional regulator